MLEGEMRPGFFNREIQEKSRFERGNFNVFQRLVKKN